MHLAKDEYAKLKVSSLYYFKAVKANVPQAYEKLQ